MNLFNLASSRLSSLFITVLLIIFPQFFPHPIASSLLYNRLASEWNEIKQQRLTFDQPFNTSNINECGIRLSPLPNDLLEWHFSFQGPEGSPFESGIYHGRIRLPPTYPQEAPSISLLSPSGRWEVGKDICLSASSYHQESWSSQWNLRTLVLSLKGYMLMPPREIGAIITSQEMKKTSATKSWMFVCPHCGLAHKGLQYGTPEVTSQKRRKNYLTSLDRLIKKKKISKNSKKSTSRLRRALNYLLSCFHLF